MYVFDRYTNSVVLIGSISKTPSPEEARKSIRDFNGNKGQVDKQR